MTGEGTAMNTSMTIGLIAVSVVAIAGGADAYKLSPASTRFTAAGAASATLNGVTLSGTGTFKGAINKHGKGKITYVRFCGAGGCGTVGAAGLPWAMKATSATTATIANATFTSPGGNCGPANLSVKIGGGTLTYNGPFDQCSQVTFSFTTSPAISIVP